MRYGFVSRRNQDTVNKHIEALKPYELDEIVIDTFEDELDCLFEKLKSGDSVYMEEPPRDHIKFIAIYSYTRQNNINLYVKGEIVEALPLIDLFDTYVKVELAKSIGYTK